MGTQTECSQKCSSEADHNVAQLGASEQDAPRFRGTRQLRVQKYEENLKYTKKWTDFSANLLSFR